MQTNLRNLGCCLSATHQPRVDVSAYLHFRKWTFSKRFESGNTPRQATRGLPSARVDFASSVQTNVRQRTSQVVLSKLCQRGRSRGYRDSVELLPATTLRASIVASGHGNRAGHAQGDAAGRDQDNRSVKNRIARGEPSRQRRARRSVSCLSTLHPSFALRKTSRCDHVKVLLRIAAEQNVPDLFCVLRDAEANVVVLSPNSATGKNRSVIPNSAATPDQSGPAAICAAISKNQNSISHAGGNQ